MRVALKITGTVFATSLVPPSNGADYLDLPMCGIIAFSKKFSVFCEVAPAHLWIRLKKGSVQDNTWWFRSVGNCLEVRKISRSEFLFIYCRRRSKY